MIEYLLKAFSVLLSPKRRGEFPRARRVAASPNAKLKMPNLKRAYERWAKARLFEADDRGYRAMVGGKLIRIRTGLEGSAPIAVEIEVSVEHDAPTALVMPGHIADDAPLAIRRVAQALFDHPEYVLPIRSIAFAPGLIRIRMPPLTAPEGITRVLEVFEEPNPSAKPRPASTPYRG